VQRKKRTFDSTTVMAKLIWLSGLWPTTTSPTQITIQTSYTSYTTENAGSVRNELENWHTTHSCHGEPILATTQKFRDWMPFLALI